MRWKPALNWKWLLSYFLIAAGVFVGVRAWQTPLSLSTQADVDVYIQLGFYDLMSRRKEIYDSHMQTVNDAILPIITSPNDNRFVLKGKFTEINEQNGKRFFSYTPIYYSTVQKGLMIDGLVDTLMHVDFWMQPVYVDNQSVVVGQTGAIFLYPLHK
ncbi:hypothetical protein SIL08_07300 [Scandinavium sp. V105_16]|uniref:Uncharacterized protein n=1 Tax=Scandinavium lactucae TaxID=3095028 RepID=A0AAJ2VSM9_9ENTR|nr:MULTISPECIES: hypothetical protein [unclassified Scandinavium]MDX6020076.1 hypothetical protein [Scandinavium sp. V105_16]MDX6032065.1 hypothetical protein [Scandinavium sp. V105_12]MDX6040625.1 hypothetical protein [Scandinavium sp. V105_6]MDX6051529.1 hypothetical protein [Scandinavium sp. V105_1]